MTVPKAVEVLLAISLTVLYGYSWLSEGPLFSLQISGVLILCQPWSSDVEKYTFMLHRSPNYAMLML
ncbi:MAG: hypothetical protein MI921_03340 [Cytophagales bacterium]|nr:hypothetical protein [Cytophagales bacterium]